MFDLLLDPIRAEKKPWDLYLFALLFSVVALVLSNFLFDEYLGFGSVVLLSFFFFPLLFRAFRHEEEVDAHLKYEGERMYAHRKIITLFVFLFLGSLTGYFFMFFLVDGEVRSSLFYDQISTIESPSLATGNAIAAEAALISILRSNFFLLGLCFFLSFIFGFGGLLLLLWNSSVFGIAIALFIQKGLYATSMLVPLAFIRYLLHGLPEVVSFFMASLGGSVLSFAVLRHDLRGEHGKRIFQDGLTLTIASVLLLILSALIEVFLTPYFF